MANESMQPYTGPQTIDLLAIASILIDMAPGGLRGLRHELPGLDGVISELAVSVPAMGAKASVSPDAYADFEKTHGYVQQIRAARLVVDKLAEVLAESEAYYENRREIEVTLIATAVRTSARHKDASLRAAFEKTLTYYSQKAMKAVKSRRKNAKSASDSDSEEGVPPTLREGAPAGTQ